MISLFSSCGCLWRHQQTYRLVPMKTQEAILTLVWCVVFMCISSKSQTTNATKYVLIRTLFWNLQQERGFQEKATFLSERNVVFLEKVLCVKANWNTGEISEGTRFSSRSQTKCSRKPIKGTAERLFTAWMKTSDILYRDCGVHGDSLKRKWQRDSSNSNIGNLATCVDSLRTRGDMNRSDQWPQPEFWHLYQAKSNEMTKRSHLRIFPQWK